MKHGGRKMKEKTVDEIIDDIDNVLEPVIGCPTIQHPHQKVKKDYDEEEGSVSLLSEALNETHISFRITEDDVQRILDSREELRRRFLRLPTVDDMQTALDAYHEIWPSIIEANEQPILASPEQLQARLSDPPSVEDMQGVIEAYDNAVLTYEATSPHYFSGGMSGYPISSMLSTRFALRFIARRWETQNEEQ